MAYKIGLSYPDPPFLPCFFSFPCFSLFAFFLVFCAFVFPFSKDFKGSAQRNFILKIRSYSARSDLKNKQKTCRKYLIFRIRSYSARSDLKIKIPRFSGEISLSQTWPIEFAFLTLTLLFFLAPFVFLAFLVFQHCLQWGRSNLADPAASPKIRLLNLDLFTKFSLVRTPEIY